MSRIVGMATPSSLQDYFERVTLRFAAFGAAADAESKRLLATQNLGADAMARILGGAQSAGNAEACIRRFAEVEANLRTPELKGLGRMNGVSFPRLGGVLYSDVKGRPGVEPVVRAAVEMTLHAGYLSTFLAARYRDNPRAVTDAEMLWQRWVPWAVSGPEEVYSWVWNIADVIGFWSVVLEEIGLEKVAKKLGKARELRLLGSLQALAFAGGMLAMAENKPL